MARDLSCPSGKRAYKTKRDALAGAEKGESLPPAKRCHRCRWWHRDEPSRRGGGTRK